MKTLIVSGSHRQNSQSGRVAEYARKRLGVLKLGTDDALLDLGKTPLPMWDEGVFEGREPWKTVWTPWLEQARRAEAFIFVSPEWAGMVPPALLNFLLLASGTGALAHKPALIVTVSASRGGAYPVSELRSSGYKNTYLNYIPEQIIVRNAADMLQGETPNGEDDTFLRQRFDYALKLLGGYAKGLNELRSSGLVDLKTYPNGM